MNRGERRHRNQVIIRRRVRHLLDMGEDNYYDGELNRMNKRHPWDCGQTRCTTCHWEKQYEGKPYRYRRKYDVGTHTVGLQVGEGSMDRG